MTDRELLELAAKAAGIECDTLNMVADPYLRIWNPLTNDGDALRLAVKLEISINHFDSFVKAQAFYDGAPGKIVSAPINSDRLEATRRAIVRAAAAIGEKL